MSEEARKDGKDRKGRKASKASRRAKRQDTRPTTMKIDISVIFMYRSVRLVVGKPNEVGQGLVVIDRVACDAASAHHAVVDDLRFLLRHNVV